jgi:hypothetical protein
MTAKTVAERTAALRLRRKKLGLAEVRGVWAPKKMHAAIKAALNRLAKKG